MIMVKSWGDVREVFDTKTNTLGHLRKADGSLAPRLIYSGVGQCLVSISNEEFVNINVNRSHIVNTKYM